MALRKLKSGKVKLAIATLLNSPEEVDWRMKLLAQYQCTEVGLHMVCLT